MFRKLLDVSCSGSSHQFDKGVNKVLWSLNQALDVALSDSVKDHIRGDMDTIIRIAKKYGYIPVREEDF